MIKCYGGRYMSTLIEKNKIIIISEILLNVLTRKVVL
jgi:hypothetical protein